MAIKIKNLTKEFKKGKVAVDNISLSVKKGEIFGFLGPNGAGKSTTLKILTTILKPTSGSVVIEDIDVLKDSLSARMQFGYVAQEMSADEKLTGRENLYLQARYYHLEKSVVSEKIEKILKLVNLTSDVDKVVSSYSGGMKKRMDIACALMNTPKILFLDEPTLGLDIQSRQEIWEYIKILNEKHGTTVFLTTHYMEEADKICHTIAIIDEGKIKIIDTPKKLKASIGNEVIEVTAEVSDSERIKNELEKLDFVQQVNVLDNVFSIILDNADNKISAICDFLNSLDVKISNISLKKVTLNDVYLKYTGKNFKEADEKIDAPKNFGWTGN